MLILDLRAASFELIKDPLLSTTLIQSLLHLLAMLHLAQTYLVQEILPRSDGTLPRSPELRNLTS